MSKSKYDKLNNAIIRVGDLEDNLCNLVGDICQMCNFIQDLDPYAAGEYKNNKKEALDEIYYMQSVLEDVQSIVESTSR